MISNVSFLVFSINIRSINANFDNLVGVLETIQKKFSIIILSETWLLEEKDIGLNGYQQLMLSLGNLYRSLIGWYISYIISC